MTIDTRTWKNVEDLFLEACEMHGQARAEFLADKCQGDDALRRQLEELLQADEKPDRFLHEPILFDLPPSEARRFKNSDLSQVGRYKLLQEIGEGGFGVVYMADQLEPVRRKVALKLIKPGMDSRAVIARFEAERQALAMMDHPNIARVLDGGTSETGVPYFVMDLVKGTPITAYCDDSRLTTRQRLELFISVCHAIQHAHQKGIIHRDIKPSNVMVTLHGDEPAPKVIDFGVAKALNQQLTEKTLFTNYGAMIGTPQYMSPEQAAMSGLDVDTRSDVYSLGILLYELLTGQPPFDKRVLREAGFDGMRRLIRESQPPKPSVMVNTLANDTATLVSRQRQVDRSHLSRQLRADLDWIVMKAIDKDRTRRYGTAAELADDVQAYLSGSPVKAAAPSVAYRIRKLAGQNKLLFGTVASVLAAVVIGAGVAAGAWLNAIETRRQLVMELVDSVVHATHTQIGPTVKNLSPLAVPAEAKIHEIASGETLSVAQRVNTSIALGELNPDNKVGDFLLKRISMMKGNYCPSLVSVLRKTQYDPAQIQVFANKAEKAPDLETKARLAIVALYLDDPSIVEEMLQNGPDPIQRSTLLCEFANWHSGLAELVKFAKENDLAVRSGIIQLVGTVSSEIVDKPDRETWRDPLERWYESAPDLLTRNSAEWVMRRWKIELPTQQARAHDGGRDWFINKVGMTFRRIDPGRFTMGSWSGNYKIDPWDAFHDETPRQVEITRPFYFADREVTGQLYRAWRDAEPSYGIASTSNDMPLSDHVNWYEAVRFCNWLSSEEDLTECYVLDPKSNKDHPPYGWSFRPEANGYRLPTEAEWECVCRAGTITDYSWGQSTKFSPIYTSSPSEPSGSTLPNAWGIFDMHGNLLELCEDRYGMYPLQLGLLSVTKDPLVPGSGEFIVLRGRVFRDGAQRCSSREKAGIGDALWPNDIGIRVARNADTESVTADRNDDSDRIEQITRSIPFNDPNDISPHLAERALCFARLGDTTLAVDDFEALLNVMEPYEDWGALRTQFLTQLASETEIIEALSTRLPNDTHLRLCRARHAALAKDWESAADFVESILRKRDQRRSRWKVAIGDQEWFEMSMYLLRAGRMDAYRRYRSWMIGEVEKDTRDLRHQWSVLKASILAPVDNSAERNAMMQISIRDNETFGGSKRTWCYGITLYRTGRLQEVLELMQDLERDGNRDSSAMPYVLAMAHWHLGNANEARTILKESKEAWDPKKVQLSNGWPGLLQWTHDYLSREIFLAEAENMIESSDNEPSSDDNSKP